MRTVHRHIAKRKSKDPEFAAEYDSEYQSFKIGAILKQARVSKGMTQEELAQKLHTQKTAISRIENHAEDIPLSTIEKYLHALEKNFTIIIEE